MLQNIKAVGFWSHQDEESGAECQAISPSLASCLASGQYQYTPLKPSFPLKGSGLPLAFQTPPFLSPIFTLKQDSEGQGLE